MFEEDNNMQPVTLDPFGDVTMSATVFNMLRETFALVADDGGLLIYFTAYVGGSPVDMSADAYGVERDAAGRVSFTVAVGSTGDHFTVPASAVTDWVRE